MLTRILINFGKAIEGVFRIDKHKGGIEIRYPPFPFS